jgi:hypothetical protein
MVTHKTSPDSFVLQTRGEAEPVPLGDVEHLPQFE